MMTRNVYLVGMPGCGKSSLGKRVANHMGLRYCDTDQRIEQAAGCTIPEIVAQYGEPAFRNAETNILIRVAGEEPAIISTGGGAVVRPENRRILQSSGYIVLIDRPLQDIMGDIRMEKRPLLAKKGLPEVERLYHERIEIYRSVADAVLDNSHGYINAANTLEAIIRGFFASLK